MGREAVVVFAVAIGLGVFGLLGYRLLRWARSGRGGAHHVLGAVLTEVTQSVAVHEAKQWKKLREQDGGDPDGEE